MSEQRPHNDSNREESVSVGQSIAVAIASALMLFTVVGLIASRAAITNPRSGIAPPVYSVSVPEAYRAAAQQAEVKVDLTQDSQGSGFEVTVPARQAVLLQTGLPGGQGGLNEDGTMLIPPLEPGHYLLNVGVHQVMVTAVAR